MSKEEVLHKVKDKRNILHTIKRRNANWIGRILRRNCLPKHLFQEWVGVTGRRGKRRKQLPDNIHKMTGYWKMKEETLTRTLWRTRCG